MNSILIFGIGILLVIVIFIKARNSFYRRLNWDRWYRTIYLNSFHWKLLRWRKKTSVLILTGRVACEKCGNVESLVIHHKHYHSLGREKLSDLQVICSNCHRRGGGEI